MKVQVKMGISADDLFDSIVTSVLYDVEQARGKKVPAKKLKAGFTYQKTLNAKLGGAQHVTTKITEFEPPRLYAASITSSRGVNTVRYEIEPIEGQDAISVVYEEGYEGDKTLNDLNGKLMGTLYSPFAKRKIKKRLRGMEAYIKASGASVRDDESDSVSANGELPEESQSAADNAAESEE